MFSGELVFLLIVAAVGLIAGRALRLPALVAYLLAGVLAGPGGLGWLEHSPTVERFADIGVSLLLFGAGIEFSLQRLWRTLPRLLAGGSLQVTLTTVLTAAAFRALGFTWPQAVLVGFFVSLSSTAIVMKIHAENNEIDSPQGQADAGILLFQDLALVPMMLLVPVLAGTAGQALPVAGMALLRAGGAIVGLLLLARFILPKALDLVARTRAPELFPVAALIVAFGAASLAVKIGLSLPLGMFLAGLALSGGQYAHPVFSELLPLRDAFVAVFFTSVGMLFDPIAVAAEPALLATMIGGVVLKGMLCGGIVGLLWRSRRLAILSGLGLAQVGELAFVLGREGVSSGIINERIQQACLGAAVLTMAATPFLMRAAKKIAAMGSDRPAEGEGPGIRDHVLLVGFGTTGQAVARVLTATGIRFLAVDLLPEAVTAARTEGLPVRFGDACRRAVLEEMGAAHARAVVVSVGDPLATRRIVSAIRRLNSNARILVRARRVDEIETLERLGANDVIPSEFEASIELFVRLLSVYGVPRHIVRLQESLIRADRYRPLRGAGSSPEMFDEAKWLIGGGVLESAEVIQGSPACGRTLGELNLRRATGAVVLTIVRKEKPLPAPDGTTRLEAKDLLVLYGPHESIDRALGLLEPPAIQGTSPKPPV